jgi:ABC-type nitrate/sulfonate/bicarbonate transport system substrate-binding protein
MMRKMSLAALAACAVALAAPAAAQTELRMVSFGGATNLPSWVAEDKGFFAKEGLKVSQSVTSGSVEQVKDLFAGKYQIISTVIDNVVAYAEEQGEFRLDQPSDMIAIAGVHSGVNSLVVRPEIKTYADLKGKAVAVDAIKSGYASMLYQILENNGLAFEKDYTVFSAGGTGARLKALKDGKAFAAILSSPTDMEAQKDGMGILADAASAIGNYQGAVYVVRRSWAKDHDKEALAFIRAIVAATDFIFDNRSGAIEVLKTRLKGVSDEDLGKIYERITGPGGLTRKAALNMEGIQTVLNLRGRHGEPKRQMGPPTKYVEASYYERALGRK